MLEKILMQLQQKRSEDEDEDESLEKINRATNTGSMDSLKSSLSPSSESPRMFEKGNKKLRYCCNSRSHCVRRTVYWQAIKPIQRVEFMNAPKLYLLKRDYRAWQTKFSSSRSQWITECNTTSARLTVCLKFAFSSISFIRCVLWLNDTYYSKSVRTDK